MRNSRYSQIWRLQHLGGVLAAGVTPLTACQHLGPWALEEGRARYNEKIHVTARDQLLPTLSASPTPKIHFSWMLASRCGGIRSGHGERRLHRDGTLAGLQGAGAEVLTSATAGTLSSKYATDRAGAAGGSFAYQEFSDNPLFPTFRPSASRAIATPISVTSMAERILLRSAISPYARFSVRIELHPITRFLRRG